MTDFLNDWGLVLVTFVPLAGALVSMLVPAAEEKTHKQVALLASLAALVVGVLLVADFDYGSAGALQYMVDESWIDVINSRFILGLDGISLPLMALTLVVVPLCVVYSWDHIPEPGNPKAFLILILILETGMVGTFVAQDLILFLRVLRGRAAADVLHDRRVGRREPALRVDQVLPVHAVRLGPDAAVVPRAVLPVDRPGHGRVAAHIRHAGPFRRCRRGHPRRHPGLDLRGNVRRLRGEGAHVPVPHVAARRPHGGAHGGLGDPGRRSC